MKKVISADVPVKLAEALFNFASASGKSMSQLVHAILDEWARTHNLFEAEKPRKRKASIWDNL